MLSSFILHFNAVFVICLFPSDENKTPEYALLQVKARKTLRIFFLFIFFLFSFYFISVRKRKMHIKFNTILKNKKFEIK